MKTNRKVNKISLLIVIAVIALAVAGCSLPASAQRPGTTPVGLESGFVNLITVNDSIETTGTIQAAQYAILTWKTSGVVANVPVKAGDKVKAGDVLAELEPTSIPSNILASLVDLINAQQNLKDLEPTQLALIQAMQKVAAAQDEVDARQRIVNGLGTPSSQGTIDQAEATVLLAKIQLDKAWDKYEPFQNKPESNQIRAALYNQWAEAQKKYEQAVTRLNNVKGISVNQTDLDLAKANLELAKANLEDAQQNLADLQAGADPDQVAAAEARITAAQSNLANMKITAPFDGEVLVVDVQSGDVVNAGQQAFTLANRNQLHVDTLIDETEISGVNIGDSATITLDSLPGQVLTGKVSFINPVGQQVSGNIKYPVKIDLDPVEMLVLLKATADVTIQVGEPLLSLLVPVRSIQLDDNGEFVNRLNEDGSIERIDVITGDLSGDQVVIFSGDLAEGERVQLVSSNELADQMSQMPGFGGR